MTAAVKPAKKKKPVAVVASKRKRHPSIGTITANEVLTVAAFLKRLGITRTRLSEMRRRAQQMGVTLARRDGLKSVLIHGSDYLAYVAKLPAAELEPITGEA